MPCSYHFYQNPPQIVKALMQYYYDEKNNPYLDFFGGVSVANCGHCNPEITKVTIEQLQTLQHTTTIYLTQPMYDLAEKLAEVMPGDIKRSFFCNSGSEANEGAMLLARLYTQKKEFIYLEGGLHGRTFLTTNVTGISMWRGDPFLDENNFHMVKRPWDINLDIEEAAKISLQEIRHLLESRGDKIAGFIAEPIQGNGGIIIPPKWYFKEVKKLCKKYHVLMIVDEVQTGFARTGKMFAIEHFDVVPDIMVVAKALGNGIPISAFCSTDEIANVFTKPSASTLGGNAVSSKTAIAVLDYIEKHQLISHAEKMGSILKNKLVILKKKFPLIKEVRGKGLMIGAELREIDGSEASDKTDIILEKMKDRGIMIGKNGFGRNVLAFQPPLIITEENIEYLISSFESVLKEIK
ncbi:aspartate aminotransferase family protein [Mycoplasmatota bacterium]|nr:aspartate aminotransferase family protein [Mycoplasmatota bacterium]